MRANTDWFRDARWGVFMHYLADNTTATAQLTPEIWNRQIDAFDVDGLAAQLAEVGAGYFFLTLGQNSGYFLSPNARYDAIVGYQPSRLAQRDLVADMITALRPYGIPMMVYLPSLAPCNDRQAIERLQCTPSWDPSLVGFRHDSYTVQADVDERLSAFQRHWEAIIREWSLRWGEEVYGWWIDGCYQADRMYRHPDEPNFSSFAAAAKAGNPQSLVAFNPGVLVPVICHSADEDYTAGEIGMAFPTLLGNPFQRQESLRYIDGAQYHILSYLGEWWGASPRRFPDEFVIGYTQMINAGEGVVTWDVPPTPSGRIPDAFMAQLRALGAATR